MQVFGLRREDKSRWERRAPLIPQDVAELCQNGFRAVVEPYERRIYTDAEYREAGAELSADLGAAKVIFAVKEVPLAELLAGKTYVFFSHVIKGQKQNMPLLERVLELGITLIDYEKIVDERGRRLIFFSREAGQAGMIDALHFLGRRFAWEGMATPLEGVRRAFEYEDVESASEAVAAIGERLRRGFDEDEAPLVVGFTGAGEVSRGAQEIFDLLPHEEVAPEDLSELAEKAPADRLFKVCFKKEHLAQPRKPGAPFDEAEYREHPERFRGGRLVRYLPHVTVLVHGVYWSDAYPRFLTRREAASMWKAGGQKLRLIADISCDIDGSIELTYKSTTPGRPTYVFDPVRNTMSDGYEGSGIIVLAVDHLPCELPRGASVGFSQALRDFVPAIVSADYDLPFEDLNLPPEIRRAVIAHRGELMPDYRYLAEFLPAEAEL